jgi:hypothetical protein
MAQVDPATEVHSSCHNFKLVGNDGSADKGTALPPATIKSRLTGIINTGVQCMRNLKAADGTTPAHTSNRMADELLANVYARANNESAKKLNIRCDRPAARVNEAGYANNVMATTSNFADPEFPSIFLNRLPEERFDQTVFHELLHLSGTQGHQCLHRNNDAREMDRIQSCAACCFPIANSVTTNTDFKLLVPEIRSDEQLKQLSCNVCSGNLSVVDSMIAYAKTEIAQGGGTSLKYAAIELRKAVQLDPNNYEAWRLLGEVLNLFANPTDARQMRVVAALDQAAAHAPNEAARRSILASASYQRANRFSRTEAAGRLTTGNYLTRSASTADQDLALQYEKKRSLFLMTINSCGPHIETTSGPNCHDLATTHLAAMAQEYKLMAKKNSESKSAMYRPYNEETLTRMRNMIKTYRDVALPCLQNAGGSIQSCIGTDEFDGMREAAFP